MYGKRNQRLWHGSWRTPIESESQDLVFADNLAEIVHAVGGHVVAEQFVLADVRL